MVCPLSHHFPLSFGFQLLTFSQLINIIHALINTSNDLASEPNICLISLFDNKAVGSNTAYGVDSNLLPAIL
ncbi:hypothetical protein BC938DRAFT_471661 [Jimgerdemannia flammicorona]|uniref:Uncharacterized protein n=1 Tax=Jimgerdemannia flammicorona TaxID=994334 RepID=A0A433Q7P4_9FUNG|nr:hypothetical protein BC938DRAFT_471661 [Jimgerdemannia flammicorona]